MWVLMVALPDGMVAAEWITELLSYGSLIITPVAGVVAYLLIKKVMNNV